MLWARVLRCVKGYYSFRSQGKEKKMSNRREQGSTEKQRNRRDWLDDDELHLYVYTYTGIPLCHSCHNGDQEKDKSSSVCEHERPAGSR